MTIRSAPLFALDVLDRAEGAALGQAARRYARFLDIPLTLTGPLRS